jgi:hypothetical protein
MIAATVLSAVALVAGPGAASTSPPEAPYLSTATDTFALKGWETGSIGCRRIDPPIAGPTDPNAPAGSPPPPVMMASCYVADFTLRVRPTLAERLRAPFRGTITLYVPTDTTSVRMGYGNRPGVVYHERSEITWKVPGSGTYYVSITLRTQTDEFTYGETTYAVPLWVPRNT